MMYLQNSPMSFASTQMLGSNFFKEKSRLLDDNKRLFTMRWWWGRTPCQTQQTGLVLAANGCFEELRNPPT